MTSRRNLLLAAPLGIATVAGVAFWRMLAGMKTGSFDPRGLPSELIGRPLPDFALPAQAPSATGFSAADVRAVGRPVLLNFFASWCVPCIEEHPQLVELQHQGIPIWGIAYKDKPDATAAFIHRHGDPYTRIAADQAGRVAIDFGLYGVPETYFVDRTGIVRWRWAGALTDQIAADQLHPLLAHYS
jgi:cytochrome c biogenesis protein CcmG/thiol:disulfide interchange protein DsbE